MKGEAYSFVEEYKGFNICKNYFGIHSITLAGEQNTYSALCLVSAEVAKKCIDVYLNSMNHVLSTADMSAIETEGYFSILTEKELRRIILERDYEIERLRSKLESVKTMDEANKKIRKNYKEAVGELKELRKKYKFLILKTGL